MDVGFYLADQNPHRDRTIGITVYTRHLIEELSKHRELSLAAIVSTSSFKPTSASIDLTTLRMRTDNLAGRLVADQLHTLFSRPKVDVWHYPKGFLPLLFQPKGPTAGTVCDVIIQFYADRYPGARSATAYSYWLGMLRRSIPCFAEIMTISEFSKNQIEQFCERYKLRCPPITVTYLARRWNCEEILPKKKNYVLHLASKEPHKQTATLLRFWAALRSKRQDLPELQLVGELDPESENHADSMNRVQRFPRLSETELKQKFSEARALIIPSEIEGFGLPALEAFEVRTPVVFAAGTPIREILGPETPGEFSLTSVESFEVALDAVLALDASLVEKTATELRNPFSWSRCADQTIAVYKRLAI
jgi:glycosyltransferase involved in cell wall biosynthesis